jgi:hypothetical protein
MFVARDPRVSREARFALGYFISRLQRFDSTRCARHLLIKAVLTSY